MCSCCLWSTLPFNHVRSDCLDHQATETSNDNWLDCHQNALTANNSHLSIMHLNTQCNMTSTFVEFTVLINSYNIITLSETWLKDNPLLLQHVSIPGYQLCYNNRNVCKGGGVGPYIKDSIVFKRRKDIENLQPEFEHTWLEIPGKNKNSKLLLGVLYRSTRILKHQQLDWEVWGPSLQHCTNLGRHLCYERRYEYRYVQCFWSTCFAIYWHFAVLQPHSARF